MPNIYLHTFHKPLMGNFGSVEKLPIFKMGMPDIYFHTFHKPLREAFKKKNQNVHFFQIGLDPPAPPQNVNFLKKKIKKNYIFFFLVICLYNFTNLYIEVFIQVSWLKRHSL